MMIDYCKKQEKNEPDNGQNRYQRYEQGKKQISAHSTSHVEYEKQIKNLAKKQGV